MIVLRILRRPDGVPPGPEVHVIKPGGSIIGRAPECDIVLDDPLRLVSRRHAWIKPESGDRGVLRCLSTVAALMVNEEPVPTAQDRVVRSGDRLRIGGFEAQLEDDAPTPTMVLPRSGIEATTLPRRRAAVPQPVSRLDQYFNLDTVPDPLGPASPLPALDDNAALPAPAWSQAHGPTLQAPLPDGAPAAAAQPPTEEIQLAPLSPAAEAALQRAFLRGAGLDATTPLAWNTAWMQQIGKLLREATEGTMDLLRSRAVTKRHIRAAGTRISARENNPLKFAPDAAEALKLLLSVEQRPGFLDPLEALRGAHHDLQVHQLAMAAGMRAAVLELITRLGPEAVEAAEGRVRGLAGRIPLLRDAALWRRHRRLHAQLLANLDDSFEAAFGRAFVRAYEEQVKHGADPAAAHEPADEPGFVAQR